MADEGRWGEKRMSIEAVGCHRRAARLAIKPKKGKTCQPTERQSAECDPDGRREAYVGAANS